MKDNRKCFGNLIYLIVSVTVYLYVCIFLIIGLYKSFSTYGTEFDVKSSVELTPIKAYEQYERSWKNNTYIGPNGGVGTNGKGYHPVYSVYMDFYTDNTKQIITIKAEDVYGIANLEKCKEIVEDGDSITRNIYYKYNTDELVGVTKGGSSVLDFYLQNATGLIVLIFVFVMLSVNTIFSIKTVRR